MQVVITGRDMQMTNILQEYVKNKVDLAMDKIERQVRKYKEKIRQHKPRQPIKKNKVIINLFMAGEQKEKREKFSPWRVIKTRKLSSQPMSLDKDIMQMDLFGKNRFVFTNAASDALSIIYRRSDDRLVLIEP